MANPFLEDFLSELEQIEQQKLQTEPIPQEDKGFAYDVIGSTLWSFADEAGFGLPEYAARKMGYEEEVESLMPESLTAKIGSGVGALAGFALGLPYKTGTKLASYAVRPFLKETVEEAGEYALGQTAKQVAKEAKKKAVDAGMKKEVAEDFTNKYISLTHAAGSRADISKDFVAKSTKAIDDLIVHHGAKGNLSSKELGIVNNIFKRDLTRKPISDFKELFSARNIGGDKAALYGNMADEVLIFGAIDAISEGVRSQAQDRPYDWMAPVWGGAIGVGFGGLKFLAPKGKSSNFRTELVDGIKGYMNRDIFAKMGNDKLKKQSRWLGDVLSDSAADKNNIIQNVTVDGRKFEFDLMNPEFLDQHGSTVAGKVMKKGLNQLRQKYSKELINSAIKEEWGSLSENFLRMTAGGVIMSSRTLYEMTQGADIPAEDVIPTMLIGGWVNRRGMARVYDLHTRTNKIRKNLSVLNVDTRNLVLDIPTFNPYLASYNNPTEVNDNIKAFRDKAEELGIITDSYEQSELNLDPTAESVLAAEANKGGYDVFKAFYQLLGGQKKFTKPLDRISTKDADILQNLIKDVKWEQLDGKTVTNAQEAFQVFDNIAQQSSDIFERNMVTVLDRISKIEGLNIDTTKLNINDASMGSFPKRLLASDEVVLDEASFLGLARDGKIIDGLSGDEAVAKVNEYIKKVNLIVDGLGNDGGIARLKLEEPTRDQLVSDKDTFDSIKLVIDEFENAINMATGARNDFRFDTMNHLEDLVWLMHTNNAKKAAEKISGLVTQGSPGHDQLKQLLMNSGILRLNDDLTMSMVNSANKKNIIIEKSDKTIPENDSKYRRLLASVIGLLGAKGEYARTTVAEPTVVKISDVLALEGYLKSQGMRTDAFVMDQWNNYVIDYINRKNIEGSTLDMNDITFISTLMDNEIAGLAEFSKSAGQGYIVSKIEVNDLMSDKAKAAAESYNTYVDGLITRGSGAKGKVVSPGKAKEYVDEDVLFALDAEVARVTRNIEGSANKVLTDMLNSLRGNHATFVEQMRVFSNTNGSHALLLNKLLIQAKVISKEGTANKTQWKFDEDKLTKEVIKDLKETMDDYGTSFDDIDALLQRENENMNELFNRLDDKPIDTHNSLSQDQFFKRYISDTYDIKTQNETIDTFSTLKIDGMNPMVEMAKQLDVKFRVDEQDLLYKDLDLNNNRHLQAYKEYLDHAGALMSSRSNSTKKVILSFDNGNTTGRYRTMQKTPFMEFLDSIGYVDGNVDRDGLNYYFLSGSADNIVMDNRGISRKHFSIFDGDSNHLSKADKAFLDSQRQQFEDNLSGLNGIDVRKKMSMHDIDKLTFDGGLALFRISGSLNPIAIPKKELFKIRDAYAGMLEKYKDQLGSRLYNDGLDRLKKLDAAPTVKSASHEVALRQLMFEKLLSSKNDATNFINALKNDVSDLGKLGSRFNLLHTPNFKRLDRTIAESMAVTSADKALVNKFHNRGSARVAIWNDKDHSSVKESLKEHIPNVDDFFKNELYGRGDETSYDSISYISKEYMDYLKLSFSRNSREGTELFKPVISSNEDALLFGKTVFVYEPKMDGFFDENGVDILTTVSASKVKGEGWKMIEATDQNLPGLRLESNQVREIPLESIGIKQDRIKDKDMAKFSIQAYNYLSSSEADAIFGEMYSNKLNLAMDEMKELYENPLRRRAFFQKGFGDDQSIESLMETGAGSQNLAAALRYSRTGDPIDLGQKMIMSQFYRKLVDPVVNQTAMLDGQRVGGKAVLIQSLDMNNKVKPTIFRDGELKQYGEIMIPAHEADEMLSMKSGEKNRVRILERNTNKVLELEDVFGKEFTKQQIEQQSLGDLHEMLSAMFSKDKYQVAIVTNRYPRTRPNDMTIMGLKGFLDESYGNSMIVNDLDVLNIFEGDYDVDKNDYYFRHSKNVFNHIQEAQHNFVQGIDPGRFSADIPNLALTGNDEAINKAWHTHAANSNTLRAGIGIVQKLQRSVNWFKDKLGTKDEETGLYNVLEGDDFTIRMDYDNKDWWHRTVLETQGIIDAGSGVDGQLVDVMGNWRSEYLFPPVSTPREKVNDSQYLQDLRNGGIPERISLFRKFDKNTGKEVALDTVEKEMILYHLNKYGKFLSLSTNIYDGSGMGKKPSYHDVIDYSDDFFSYASNHQTMFYALNSKFKDKKKYTSGDRRKLRSYFKTDYFETTDNDGNVIKRTTYPTSSPFSEDFRVNLENSANGKHGNVYDKLMWNIHNSDPMGAKSYSGLVGNEIKQLDQFFQRASDDVDYDQFTSDILKFAGKNKKQLETLMFLRRKYGFLNRLRVSAKRKQELISKNNEAIAELELQLEGTLPYKYLKSKSARDLKDAHIKILDIDSSQQLKDDTTVLYTLEELTRHDYGGKGMDSEIKELKSFERRIFGDLNDLGQTLPYDKRTALSQDMKDYLQNIPNFATLNEMIEMKLQEGVERHGFSFLFHYAMPSKQNAVGIFNGTAHAVSHKRNARFERILKFMGKNADVAEFSNALAVIGQVSSHYRFYFNKDHRLLGADNMRISEDIYAFQDGMKFPKFSKGMQNAFDSFRNFKWMKDTGGNADPFKIQDDYSRSFYEDFFDSMGRGDDFKQYMGQRSVLQQHLLSTQHVDPIAYLSMVSKMDRDIHDFASKKITGVKDHDGNYWKFDKNRVTPELRSNPIYHLLGGDRFFKGISLNFPKRQSNYDLNSMQAFSKQANTIVDESPSDRRAGKIFDVLKACSIGGS